MSEQKDLEIIEVKLHSEVRRVARILVRDRELLLDVSNRRLEVWAKHFSDTEPELLDFIDAMPADAIYYDIGASIGHFALYAAMQVKNVYALEPEALNFATASLNHFLNREALTGTFVALNVAASEVNALEYLGINLYGAGEHTKALSRARRIDGADATRPLIHKQPALTLTLDTLISLFKLSMPSHLKVDVDGAESSVLEGATACFESQILKKVFIELQAGPAEDRCKAFLTRFGLEMTERHNVRRISGGFYKNLTNCVFTRA